MTSPQRDDQHLWEESHHLSLIRRKIQRVTSTKIHYLCNLMFQETMIWTCDIVQQTFRKMSNAMQSTKDNPNKIKL
jgi:hypothetical protein